MRKIKQFFSILLAAIMLMTVVPIAFAAVSDTGFSDVSADAWYAEGVRYVNENSIMSGTGNTLFSPQGETSRAMLAAVLYRMEGSPAVSGQEDFTDVQLDNWYTNAVIWAVENGIISGYGNGLFGTNDPVSHEQASAILWRYAGSPETKEAEDFADEDKISAYAVEAVDWMRDNQILNGNERNTFDPQGNATRAEIAMMLYHFMEMDKDTDKASSDKTVTNDGKVLVVYFSATGSTKAVAETIADTLDADTFELVPADPYNSEDLDWTEDSSRVNAEHDTISLRDIKLVSNTVENWDSYDTVFIGYPIWWGIAAWPVDSFVTANDFTGKKVIPFCTSSSSELGESRELLAEMAGSGDWQEGRRFRSGVAESDVLEWVNSLNLNAVSSNSSDNQEPRSLVVYFSMPETNRADNMTQEEDNSVVVIDGEVLGNTQYMASVIQKQTGADIFRIEPETPYPVDHETLVDLAADEQDENARPAMKDSIENMDNYDVIYVGYPIWWSDMPMIMYTFFDEYDLSGKTIVPFGTHGGSRFAGTPDTIAELEPSANVLGDGLTISRNDIQNAEDEIISWVNGLGL